MNLFCIKEWYFIFSSLGSTQYSKEICIYSNICCWKGSILRLMVFKNRSIIQKFWVDTNKLILVRYFPMNKVYILWLWFKLWFDVSFKIVIVQHISNEYILFSNMVWHGAITYSWMNNVQWVRFIFV